MSELVEGFSEPFIARFTASPYRRLRKSSGDSISEYVTVYTSIYIPKKIVDDLELESGDKLLMKIKKATGTEIKKFPPIRTRTNYRIRRFYCRNCARYFRTDTILKLLMNAMVSRSGTFVKKPICPDCKKPLHWPKDKSICDEFIVQLRVWRGKEID